MDHRLILSLLCSATLAALATSQEKYWVASSAGVRQVDPAAALWQTVLPTSSRDIAVAPDGKIWLVAAGITVRNADGTPFTTITPSPGIAPYSIAFDRAGHAWVTGSGGGVEEFDAVGNSLGTLTLPAASPRVICVDADGNKWIAHRVGPPGSLSRIDAVTRAVTNHAMPAGSLILPITVYADARGLFTSSHIWVVGDNRGAGEVCEFDSTGTALNRYVISATARLQWMSGDCDSTGITRNIWVGDWGNGDLHKVDAATGAFTSFPQGNGVGGVTFDGFGKLWLTIRGTGLLRRLDPVAGTAEVDAALSASNQMSTRWQHATVVDPLGDLDLDGAANVVEVMGGTSPFDGCSLTSASVSIQGSMGVGSTVNIAVIAGSGVLTLVGFAFNTALPGSSFPGVGCAVELNPATFLTSIAVFGPASIPLTIPSSTGFVGVQLTTQGLNAGVPTFTNVAPMLFW